MPLRLMVTGQALAIPLSFVLGVLAALGSAVGALFGETSFFLAIAGVLVVSGPVLHGALLFSLLVKRAWAWQRTLVLAWTALAVEAVYTLLGMTMDWSIVLWMAPLLAIDVMTVVHLRHPLVEHSLGATW